MSLQKQKGGGDMRSTAERRQMILQTLWERRSELAENLALEFDVSIRTIYYDKEIIARISNSVQREKFQRLHDGDWSGYESQSSADFALVRMLTIWTQDESQIDSIFRQAVYIEKNGKETIIEKWQ